MKGDAAIQLSASQRLDWLRLIRSENVGPRSFRLLVNHYGGARAALAALPDLARRGGAVRSGRICSEDEAAREMRTAEQHGIMLAALGEAAYPARLAQIADPPPLLAIRGKVDALARPIVALVGSRNASAAGMKMAELLARGLGENGFMTVSGLARGVDAAVHRATLASGTIAVLAGGHAKIYPPENVGLLGSILEHGVAVSEMPHEWEPRARDFPRRNRIISGVAVGVVVVEAAKRSGSLITARMALEQGREVFAVPGSPLDPRAEGTNGLIKQGAALVTGLDDILSVVTPILGELTPPAPILAREPTGEPPLGDPAQSDRERIVALLGPTPVSVDVLIRLADSRAAIVRTVLLELELAGRLQRQGGLVSLI